MLDRTLNGRYNISSVIGSGEFTDVYLATDLQTEAVVAAKVLNPHFARDPAIAKTFLQEANAARKLVAPHVARVLDANEDDKTYYAIVEHVEGHTLAHFVKLHHHLSIYEAILYIYQILQAVEAAHRLGCIHQNIKPQNVIVGPDDIATVTDFGIAKHVAYGMTTQAGAHVGTPQYMSPEQINGMQIDARSDLYAVAITLFEFLMGRPPFDGEDSFHVRVQQLNSQPPQVTVYRPNVTIPLQNLIDRGLEKDPDRRFQSATQMLQELDEICKIYKWHKASPFLAAEDAEQLPSATEEDAKPPAIRSGEEQPRPSRRKTLIIAVVAAMCLAMIATLSSFAFLGPVSSVDKRAPVPTTTPLISRAVLIEDGNPTPTATLAGDDTTPTSLAQDIRITSTPTPVSPTITATASAEQMPTATSTPTIEQASPALHILAEYTELDADGVLWLVRESSDGTITRERIPPTPTPVPTATPTPQQAAIPNPPPSNPPPATATTPPTATPTPPPTATPTSPPTASPLPSPSPTTIPAPTKPPKPKPDPKPDPKPKK